MVEFEGPSRTIQSNPLRYENTWDPTLHLSYVRPSRAVGECPKPQGLGICVEECAGDEFCGPGEKCCSNGCGHVCIKVFPVRPSRAVGKCPKPRGVGACVEKCISDESCAPGKRCCSNGCGHVCIKVSRDFCQLPSDSGSCNATSVLRFFYNSQSGRCEKFPYKGCGGNKNNFATHIECLQACSDRGICRLPVDQGWGDALRTRFFYNSTSRTCESFFYRGHRGNANNFWEKEDCLRFCVVRAETEAA
ncbi:actinia tenebrosa protease inhibitors-like [Sceloporus undulatus]|uniref:actinia tenebrosa protease inhibitors-like n=1 Tax=Sceloporus undulatus TaxID=8520 RepID=UPI001C4C13AB|nr:actinia tenebrosa protease inhibitors-like [Sceloporus undulatus]